MIRENIKYYLTKFKIIPRDPFQEILEKILLDLPDFKIEAGEGKFLRKSHRLNDTLNNIEFKEIHNFDISDGERWRYYCILKP